MTLFAAARTRRHNQASKRSTKLRSFCLEPLESRHLLTTIFVDVENSPGPGSGTARDPFVSIQTGIDRARSGDDIRVAAGKYTENLKMKSGVNVLGAGAEFTTLIGKASKEGVVLFDSISKTQFSGFTITVDRPVLDLDRGVVLQGRTDETAMFSYNVVLNTQAGILVNDPAAPSLVNNTLVGDRDELGIFVGNDPTAPVIKNNIITGYETGIHVIAGTARPIPVIEFNDIVGNRVNYRNFPDLTGRAGNISQDPLFEARDDFRLQKDSPAINFGDPNSPADPDGTRADMGAIPFQHEDEPEPPEFAQKSVSFSIESTRDVPFELFSVNTPGKIVVDAFWRDPDQTLTVELQGRRRLELPNPTEPYATATGKSGLRLSYEVTEVDLARGVAWRVIVKDPSGTANVKGAISITIPFDEKTEEQFQREKVSLRSGDHWPTQKLTDTFFNQLSTKSRLHGIISMTKACNCFESRRLEMLGLVRQSFMSGRHAFGYVDRGLDPNHANVQNALRFVTPLDPEDKIDPHVLVGNLSRFSFPDDGLSATPGMDNYVILKGDILSLSVKFASDVPDRRKIDILNLWTQSARPINEDVWQVAIDQDAIVPLAEFDEVEWIEAALHPGLADLNLTRQTINANQVQNSTITGNTISYAGLSGNGITVGVQDTGIDGGHNDLNVVVTVSSNPINGHGTHVAGILSGSGTQSNQTDSTGANNGGTAFQFRGVAPRANVIGTSDVVTQGNLKLAVDSGLDSVNRSQSFSFDGGYEVDDQAIDKYIRGGSDSADTIYRHPWVVSAGNHQTFPGNQRPAGPAAGTPAGTTATINAGQIGYFSLTKQTKNSLIVGNWDATNNRLSTGSSLGPAHDGRIKPDVVAPGTSVISTGTNGATSCRNANVSNGYGPCSGTSMATPAVSGVYAQLLEGWHRTYSVPLGTTVDANPPLPSTLRAIVVQTSRDVFDEDVNANGILDAGEDVDGDGSLTVFGPGITNPDIDQDGVAGTEDTNGNGTLEAFEDLNGNGILETVLSDGNGRVTTTVGPDYATGWGLVDAQAAALLLLDQRDVQDRPVPNRIIQDSIFQDNVVEYDFVVDQDLINVGNPMKVTLAWDDWEASTQAIATNSTLVNDLDLELVAPDGTIFYPWQLGHTIADSSGNPLANNQQPPGTNIQVQIPLTPISNPSYQYQVNAAGNWGAGQALTTDFIPQTAVTPNPAGNNDVWVARKGKDHLNNIEQVEVNAGQLQVGHWRARVIGFDVQSINAQDFSLVGFPYPDVPDLVAVTPERVALPDIGDSTEFTWEAQNIGPEGTNQSFAYEIFLSRDFALGPDDVSLNDVHQAAIGPLTASGTANDSVDVTSEIQITQANADALMGTPAGTTTIDDLIADDVFLLVRVDSGDDILEHNETNLGVLQLARQADVVLVYDRSGSMGATVPVSNGSQSKLGILQDSANLFLDLMRLDAGDKLAEVSFADSASIDFGPTPSLTLIETGNIQAAKDEVNSLVANGGTNIREALQKAIDLFPSDDGARRRVIIFFSDGMKSVGGEPDDPAFLQQLEDKNIQVFSVGFGTRGGSGIAGIDTELLQTLSTSGEPGFFQVTENPLDLDKFFVNAVAGAIDSEVIVDPVDTIESDEVQTFNLNVNEQDRIATFILTWDNPQADLALSLVSPSGQEINSGNISQFDDKVRRITNSAYKLMEVQLPLGSGPEIDHAGQWQMIIENLGNDSVEYSASAIAQSTVRFSVAPPDPGADEQFTPGDSIPFTAVFHQDNQASIHNSKVMVTPSIPAVGLGDFLAVFPISATQLAQIPEKEGGEILSQQERMYRAAKSELKGDPLARIPSDPFELRVGGAKNEFVGEFRNTQSDGVYEFLIGATGQTNGCHIIQREIVQTASIAPKADPELTEVEITTPDEGGDDGIIVVTIIPVLEGGGLLGPGLLALLDIGGDGVVTVGETVDNGDGSYSQTFEIVEAKVSIIAELAGSLIQTIVVQPDVPIPQSITPMGGSNDTAHPVVITADDATNGVTEVVFVNLGSPDDEVQLANVIPQGNQVQAVVPAGISAGYYDIYLVGDNGRGPAGSIIYQASAASGDTTPDLNGVDDTLGTLDTVATTTEGLVQLGFLMQQLHDIPTGPNFTEDVKNDVAMHIASLLVNEQGILDTNEISQLDDAFNAAKVDARFIPFNAKETPMGNDVQVDLGNGARVTFGELTKAGETTLRMVPGPKGFVEAVRGSTHVTYDITTTSTFTGDKEIEVAIKYDESNFKDENALSIWHEEDGEWVDRTTDLDTRNNIITATTNSLSPFVVVEAAGIESLLLDFGDAPAPYPTQGSNAASHQIVKGFHLGMGVDADKDGQPNRSANGDDISEKVNDEDGVHFVSRIIRGSAAKVDVAASAAGLLNAWIDFDGNGRWQGDEQIFVDQQLSPGSQLLTFDVPESAFEGSDQKTYARFRFSSDGQTSPDGPARDGEVEDYIVTVEASQDDPLTQINQLCRATRTRDAAFDLNRDRRVNQEDLAILVQRILGTNFGDANLDGSFGTPDLIQIFQRGEYEDGMRGNSTWDDGDWNCDQEFSTTDLIVAFQAGGFDPNAAVAIVIMPDKAFNFRGDDDSDNFLKHKIAKIETDENDLAPIQFQHLEKFHIEALFDDDAALEMALDEKPTIEEWIVVD